MLRLFFGRGEPFLERIPSQTPGTPDRAPRRVLVLLFLVALAVRAAVGFWASGRGEMEGLSWRYRQDAMALVAGYGFQRPVETAPPQVNLLALADSLARHGERLTPARVPAKDPALWRPSGLHPPGYAWFLSVVYRTLGEPLLFWAKTIQSLIDACACLLVYRLGRRFVGAGAGVFAAAAYAVSLPVAYLATSHVADAWMPAFYVAIIALFVRGLDTRRLAWFAASGVALGLACLLRPDSLLLPSFLFVGAIVQPGARVRGALGVGVLTAATLLVLLPWGLRNQRVTGHFQLTTSAGGMALYQSIGQFPNPYGLVFDDEVMADSARAAGFEGIDDPAASRYFTHRFLTVAHENPALLVGNMLQRVPLGIAPLYHWGYDNRTYPGRSFFDYAGGEHLNPYQAIARHPAAVFEAYWDRLISSVLALVLFAAGLALFVIERRSWPVIVLLWLPYAYLVLSHIPLMLGARLLIPGLFGQFIMLGYWYERFVLRRPVRLREI
jgi:4-amino-4-deoxy-L-arabinose transferase-like glycosyltransferase